MTLSGLIDYNVHILVRMMLISWSDYVVICLLRLFLIGYGDMASWPNNSEFSFIFLKWWNFGQLVIIYLFFYHSSAFCFEVGVSDNKNGLVKGSKEKIWNFIFIANSRIPRSTLWGNWLGFFCFFFLIVQYDEALVLLKNSTFTTALYQCSFKVVYSS